MSTIRVVVNGATGKMGVETVGAVCGQDDMTLVGAACHRNRGTTLSLPNDGEAPLSVNLEELLQQTKPDVMVDFTNAAAGMEAALVSAANSVNMVMGASGLTGDDLRQLEALASDKSIGIIVAPNFALGAVVLKRLAERAAQFFEYADIVEAHHEAKIDAPSGFAMDLARTIGDQKQFTRNYSERENLPDTRGGEYNGVTVHSIRMPGRSAHHEVIFGAPGQTVSLRHDTLSRDCYMPGVLQCIREVVKRPGLVVGLENVIGL